MMTKKSEEIIEKREPLPGYSTNKPVYLVHVRGFKNKELGSEFYVAQKVSHTPATLKIQGWKISVKTTINNLEEAERHAERDQYYDIEFPWQRVINIRNLTFKR